MDWRGSGHDRLNGTTVNRWDGWFLVPFEKAGDWRFRGKRRGYGSRLAPVRGLYL